MSSLYLQPKSIDIFLISPRKRYFGYSLEALCRGVFNEYTQYMFSWRNKNIFTGCFNILKVNTVGAVESCMGASTQWLRLTLTEGFYVSPK